MIRRVASLGGVLCSLGFLIWAFAVQYEAIKETEWNIDAGLLALSLVGLVVLFFLDALGWHFILLALDQNLPVRQSIRVWLLSSVTRYLPGGVWPYASRVVMASSAGISTASSALSLYLETLLLTSTSLAIGLPSLLVASGAPISIELALGLWLGLGLLLHPRAFKWLGHLPGKFGQILGSVMLPSSRRALMLYGYYLTFWMLFGGVFLLFATAFHPIEPDNYVTAISAMPLAFFLGFVVFFVPGGIGVREGALYILLLAALPPAVSLTVATASRVWIMAGEVLSIVIVLSLGNHQTRSKQDR